MTNRIRLIEGTLSVPDFPTIPFIEGDAIGPEIWVATKAVVEAAIHLAYGTKRAITWKEIYAGDKAVELFQNPLPDDTTETIAAYKVAIKGPLGTPVGKGIRSLNVALRQRLRLYACVRPSVYFPGVPSPMKRPELIDVVVFRENCEDTYLGIEFPLGSEENETFRANLEANHPEQYRKIPHPSTTAFGVKPVSKEGSELLIDAAISYAMKHKRRRVTLMHKGNIQKFTEGAFRDWGFQLAMTKYNAELIDKGPWCLITDPETGYQVEIHDKIADITFQQLLTRPKDFDVIATLNMNGDYVSDAIAAQVGGIGIAPGANINYETGVALFEPVHGTAPIHAGQNKVNPSSQILSAEMMLRYMGWDEAADLVLNGVKGAIAAKLVTYDFERLLKADGVQGVQLLSTSDFGKAVVSHMS
jgi:isocitrate dehydrogenase